MAGIAPGKLLGNMQEGWSRRQIPETYPDGVPEIAAATGYPDDDDLAQAIILPRRPSRNRSTRTSWGRRSWAETNGLGMAGLTDHVLELLTGRRPDLERQERRP